MKILVVEPGREPEGREMQSTLQSMQEIVGGLIQVLYPFDEPVALVANDEGKLLGLPMNRGLRDEDGNLYDILCGTFFLAGVAGDSLTSLTEEQIRHFKQLFTPPELFLKYNGKLMILPLDSTDTEE